MVGRDRRALVLCVTTTALLLSLAVDAAVALPAGLPGIGRKARAACAGAHHGPARIPTRRLAAALGCLVNVERLRHHLDPLAGSADLALAAEGHARDMVRHQFFAHRSRSGTGPAARVRATGYLRAGRTWIVGEDVACGTGGLAAPRAIMAALMASPEHRRVVLTRGYHALGIGVARGTPAMGANPVAATYVLDFGAPAGRH